MTSRYASYQSVADIIRLRFKEPKKDLAELFGRMVFNVLSGNTDDHARNHAALWDGTHYQLSPAYDICPQSRAGNIASQAMLINDTDNSSRIITCLDSAHSFLLSREEAVEIILYQVETIGREWLSVCDEAGLPLAGRRTLWKRAFFNEHCIEGIQDEI